MVTYGNASGPVPPMSPLELARRGSLFLTRPTLFHYATPDRIGAMAADVFGNILSGVLRPVIAATFPLADVAAAHHQLETGTTLGSIILKP